MIWNIYEKNALVFGVKRYNILLFEWSKYFFIKIFCLIYAHNVNSSIDFFLFKHILAKLDHHRKC